MTDNLAARYTYQTRYIEDIQALMNKILTKTVVPHQVEIQPGRMGGEKLCWLSCPYCYGHSARNSGERLDPGRYQDILRQTRRGPHGKVEKIVFAGYATDPLNYEHIDDLLAVARENGQVFGFHTKALKFSERLLHLLTEPTIRPMSYFSVSVDAGSAAVYNSVHGVGQSKADLYGGVLENLKHICARRAETRAPLDVSATYLVNQRNNATGEVVRGIENLLAAGVDLIRFTFPQLPRGYDHPTEQTLVPNRKDVQEMVRRLQPVIESFDTPKQRVLIMDLDADYQLYTRRTPVCFARFIFPAIGYDGYLAHCSESAAPHFRDMTLGPLSQRDFWDLFYDYDIEHFRSYLEGFFQRMEANDCRCDRKEHVVNNLFLTSGAWDAIR